MQLKTGLLVATFLAVSAPPSWSQDQPKGSLTIGLEAPRSISNVPMLIAADRMKETGYTVEVIDFNGPETMALALQNGQVDLASTSAGTAFSAIDAGFKGKAFMGSAKSDFQMVARKGLTSCESLDGQRVAVQSREGTTGVLTQNWFAEQCPDARPNILIVPGSENRVAGLMAGQLDAAPIDSQNSADLMQQRPGDFYTIDSFSESARLLASVFYARTDWLAEHKQAVMDFTRAYNDAVKQFYADPGILAAELNELLPDLDPAVREAVAKAWVERKVWNPVGGVQPETIQQALDFYSSAQPYKTIKSAADVSTTEYVAGLE